MEFTMSVQILYWQKKLTLLFLIPQLFSGK